MMIEVKPEGLPRQRHRPERAQVRASVTEDKWEAKSQGDLTAKNKGLTGTPSF